MWDTKVFTLITSVIIFWTSTDVVQGRFIYHSEINRWVQQDKVVATWEQAKVHCESEGAVLASPITEDLANYMTSLIDVHNHESPYFIGMKLTQNSDIFKSIEGTVLDDLPEAIINKIDKLDPREGECLGMSRSNIHVVPCWARLPYLCYMKNNATVFKPTTTPSPPSRTLQPSTTTDWPSWTTTHPITTDWPSWTTTHPITTDWPSSTTTHPTTTDWYRTTYRTTTEPLIDESTSISTHETTDCGFGYQFHSESCYKVHDEYKSWYEAESTCSDEEAYLAVINDAYEAEYLKSITSRPDDHYIRKWIGLRIINDTWISVHGDSLGDIFNIWSSSVSGLPCGVLKNDGLLDDQSCNFKYRFICEKRIQGASTQKTYEYTRRHEPSTITTTYKPARCIYGYEFHSGMCYKVHDEYKPWDEAKSTCSYEGANLAIINDANEAQVLRNITSRPYDNYVRKWIGLREINGDWRSINGDSLEQIYHVWSDSVSGLPCGAFKVDGKLDDQTCDFKYRFICEADPYFD